MINDETPMNRLLTLRIDRDALTAELRREPGLAARILADLAIDAPSSAIAPLVRDGTFQGDRMKSACFFYDLALALDPRSPNEISMISAAINSAQWRK